MNALDANERERVREVFGLTGGELSDTPWTPAHTTASGKTAPFTFTHWYSGVPEYAESDFSDWSHVEYLTVCRDEMFGSVPETVTDSDGSWSVVARFSSSGEVECPGLADNGELADHFPLPCPLCEAQVGESHGHIHLGDGWSEIVYRLAEEAAPTISDLLETPPAGCSAVADLFHWSTNYDAGKGPATLFLDMLGITQEEYGTHLYDLSEPSLGYVELEKLSAALAEYVSSPESVRTFVGALLNAEDK